MIRTLLVASRCAAVILLDTDLLNRSVRAQLSLPVGPRTAIYDPAKEVN